MNHRHLAVATLVLGVSGISQSFVSPPCATNTYTGGNNAVPWGWPSPTSTQGEVFYQQIDDSLIGPPRVLLGFAFRHYIALSVPAYSYTVTVKIGEAATPAASISMTFANNWRNGGMQTTVFSGPITFPASPSVTIPPAPADGKVPFTTPHVHLGIHPLLWEAYITSTSPQVKNFHERGATSDPTYQAGVLGAGCTITGGSSPMTSSGQIVANTSVAQMTDTLTSGPASAPAALLLGDESDLFGGVLPLPFHLALIGSQGCFLRINALASFSQTTNGSGGAAFVLPYAPSPALAGLRLRTQWAAIDSASVFRTSNGLDHAVPYNRSGKAWPQNSVYSSNFGATPPATAYANYVSGCVTTWL